MKAHDMDSNTRLFVGILLLLVIQLILGGTAVFLIRRKMKAEPAWSWLKTLGIYFLFMLLVTGVALIPGIGKVAAILVSLVGLKRLSGLDVRLTFILSFCLGILILVMGIMICRWLGLG